MFSSIISTAEWLLPVGSSDPTYPTLSAPAVTAISDIEYPNGAGDCLNPIEQPSCYNIPGDGFNYCGYPCGYCAYLSTTSCQRFKAPPVRIKSLCC